LELDVLQKKLNYSFNDPELLQVALTHSSFLNRELSENTHNQRLEFLGDAVLQLYSSSMLFSRFPEANESSLSQARAYLVCEESLAKHARQLGLGQYLLLGKGELLTKGNERDSILADAMEAVIGAVFLDGGEAAAKQLIYSLLQENIDDSIVPEHRLDAKTTLQMTCSSVGTVEYQILSESGPDHAKQFTAAAILNGETIGTGSGSTKKMAQKNAAIDALEHIKSERTK